MKTMLKVLVIAGLVMSSRMVFADDKVVSSTTTTTTNVTQAAAVMTPEQQAMMARMKEYMTINEKHELLKSMVGTWKTNAKFWMPGAPAEESTGMSENRLILDGHFLEQDFTGTAMGKPFEGKGFLGYDNMRKEYTSIWLDNMATGIMTGASQYDPATKTLKEEGSMSCPMTNETHRWYRSVTTFIDKDHYKYESYMKDEKGVETKGMEIDYTRVTI